MSLDFSFTMDGPCCCSPKTPICLDSTAHPTFTLRFVAPGCAYLDGVTTTASAGGPSLWYTALPCLDIGTGAYSVYCEPQGPGSAVAWFFGACFGGPANFVIDSVSPLLMHAPFDPGGSCTGVAAVVYLSEP